MSHKQWVVGFARIAVTVLLGNLLMVGNGNAPEARADHDNGNANHNGNGNGHANDNGNSHGDGLAKCKVKKADAAELGFTPGVHPWPCADGSEWPPSLNDARPFKFKELLHNVTVQSGDTTLVGWIGLPAVPEGTRVPVLLTVIPYMGACNYQPHWVVLYTPSLFLPAGKCIPTAGSMDHWWDETPFATAREGWGVTPLALVEQGYAVAWFSQRGTGPSGGCYESPGLVQNGDEAAIIEYLAKQSWSNGRVGIGGVSSSAGPAMLGATSGAPALKTTVVAGTMLDAYTFYHTPQGAASTFGLGMVSWGMAASASVMPPLGDTDGVGDPQRVEQRAALFAERASCPETRAGMTAAKGAMLDDRDPEFFERHSMIDDLDGVTASLLLAQGFKDRFIHQFQDTYFWPLVSAPKRQIAGQWEHGFPIPEHQGVPSVVMGPDQLTWNETVLPWLDFWLKGVGPKPDGLERVDYEETGGRWHSSSAWPPLEAREEVVYLADKTLSATPGTDAPSFQSIPVTGNDAGFAELFALPINTWPAACDRGLSPNAVVYTTAPLDEPWVVAGNPFAYLNISSNLPGGIVSVQVWEQPSDFYCEDVADPSKPTKMHMVSLGNADLRFHQGNLIGSNFPVLTPTHVRVDLADAAETIEAGNRLLVILSYGDTLPGFSRFSQPWYPTITVHPDSHLVLPFIQGTMGGAAPTIDYPPRPFMDP